MSKFIQNRRGWFIGLIVIMTFGLIVGLSSCAAGAKSLSDLNAELNGTPIAVYSGDSVTMYSTDLQKSTIFMIDGKRVLVYRADYALIPNKLLDKQE